MSQFSVAVGEQVLTRQKTQPRELGENMRFLRTSPLRIGFSHPFQEDPIASIIAPRRYLTGTRGDGTLRSLLGLGGKVFASALGHPGLLIGLCNRAFAELRLKILMGLRGVRAGAHRGRV